MKLLSSEAVLEFVARTGGIFKGDLIDRIFSRRAFLEYLTRRNELEYAVKKGWSNYIYKIPDKYIREYHNVRWKKSKGLMEKGELELRRRVSAEVKKRGLYGRYKKFSSEKFYYDIKKSLLENEHRDIYWKYFFDGLNDSHIIYSLSMQLLYITDHIIPYTKDLLTPNFPRFFWKYSGKGMYFSIDEDARGNEKNVCVIIEPLKSYESILKVIAKFGKEVLFKRRCIFYIVGGNKSSLRELRKRIQKYNKHIVDDTGYTLMIKKKYFDDVKIHYKYYPYLGKYINRGLL